MALWRPKKKSLVKSKGVSINHKKVTSIMPSYHHELSPRWHHLYHLHNSSTVRHCMVDRRLFSSPPFSIHFYLFSSRMPCWRTGVHSAMQALPWITFQLNIWTYSGMGHVKSLSMDSKASPCCVTGVCKISPLVTNCCYFLKLNLKLRLLSLDNHFSSQLPM